MKKARQILLIEDNKTCSDLYKDRLEADGFTVKQAWSGEEGLAELKKFKPDVIILDLLLPKMSGEEVLDHLKNKAETKDIPVAILTAILNKDSKERELRQKADDYMVKIDVTPKELVERITGLIK